jgi:hypothetical protein
MKEIANGRVVSVDEQTSFEQEKDKGEEYHK